MLVFVFDSLWREAPLKPSVCSTKRFLISPKKQKMHALLRFLQIWSCGKICHNYPGGVTPICFPGHSMWFAVGHIWSKYFEKDLRTVYFHSTKKTLEFGLKAVMWQFAQQVLQRRQKVRFDCFAVLLSSPLCREDIIRWKIASSALLLNLRPHSKYQSVAENSRCGQKV